MSPTLAWTFPLNPSFSTAIPIRITDLNYGRHVGNDSLVSLLHEARVRFLAKLGASELDAGSGAGLILRELEVRFRTQIRYGDEVRVEVVPAEVRKASFDLLYRVRVGETTAAEARTGMGCFDYARQRPVALPESLRIGLEAEAAGQG